MIFILLFVCITLTLLSIMLLMLSSTFLCSQQLLEERTAKLTEEETAIMKKQTDLKKALYARFGDSINLDN